MRRVRTADDVMELGHGYQRSMILLGALKIEKSGGFKTFSEGRR